jgi:hypothetical protein
VTAFGDPVSIDNGDHTGIDFDLVVPPGLGMITGRVTDADLGVPMPDVHLALLDENGNPFRDTSTDGDGNYYFSALGDRSYKVIADGVPEGYTGVLYPDVPCHEWSCDTQNEGALIAISGANIADNRDIALDFTGTRIIGTVTRSDTHDPVSSEFGVMVVNLFDANGQHIGETGTNRAGQYQYTFAEGGDYYLSTRNDDGYHALMDEAWDNIPCLNYCNPKDSGGNLISINEGQTLVRDFELDPWEDLIFKNGFE